MDFYISVVETKFGQKLQAHRYIYMKSICRLYTDFIKNNDFISFLQTKTFLCAHHLSMKLNVVVALNARIRIIR